MPGQERCPEATRWAPAWPRACWRRQSQQELRAHGLRQQWGDSIAYLSKLRTPVPREPEPIWECLDPCRFSYRERSVLTRMYVPVAVFGDMRGDRATETVPGQSLVLVVEDVGPVPLQSLRQIGIRPPFGH